MNAPKGMAILILAACGADSPSSPTASSLSPVVLSEWAIAQQNLAPYVGGRASSVTPDAFRWIEHGGKFPCPPDPEPRFNGCFLPDAPGGPRIEFDATAPSIVRHEGGHAILWALGDPRWDCFEHDLRSNPNYEPACASGVRR